MKVLVTGSSGRVGRAISIHLSHRHDVVGLDRAPSSTVDHVGDVGDPSLLSQALQGIDAVVHTAALHAPHVGLVPDEHFQRINVDATRRLYEEAARTGVRRFVFTSSTAVYGAASTPSGEAGWVDEALPPQPENIYHRSKLAAEAWLREAASQGGPGVRILRMSRCFPEAANVMAVFRLHRGIDVRDVARAHAAALEHEGDAAAHWIISAATPLQRADVQALHADARAVLEQRAPALVGAFQERGWTLPARIDRVYDASRAQRELGWQPRYGFEEVLAMYDAESSEVLRPRGDFGWNRD